MPRVLFERGSIETAKADAIVVNLFQGVQRPAGATGVVDKALGGAISELVKLGDFKGKAKEVAVVHTRGVLPAPRVLIVGLGKPKEFTVDVARQVSARVAAVARDRGHKRIATILHGAGTGRIDAAVAAKALVEGAVLGLYQFREYKSKPKVEEGEEPEKELEEIRIVEMDAVKLRKAQAVAEEAHLLATVTNDVRTLVNRPSKDKTPDLLAKAALDWSKRYGFKARIMEKPELEKHKMEAILGVGAGSVHAPKLVVLETGPAKPKGKTVLFVGKGITFDSGGISIKPAAGMDAMRHDMAGAAAVLGTLAVAAKLGTAHRVLGLLPLAENMPSGSAIRPGDILRAFNGTTIEVSNTDAEGRLVLADALSYGIETFKPDLVVDIATLTGSIKVALGAIMTGAFGNDEALIRRLVEAGDRVGDELWMLPITKEHESHVKSEVADVRNVGVNYGGSVTAAAFLKNFVGKTKWAHLDIAGTCWTDRGSGELKQDYHPKGATGIGVRLFWSFLGALR